jgi:Tol biopolymer transport system component/Flp pilus assembly protein TadD
VFAARNAKNPQIDFNKEIWYLAGDAMSAGFSALRGMTKEQVARAMGDYIARWMHKVSIPMEARIPIDLDISADGKRVAFVVMERVLGEPQRRQRIWVTETEQAAPRPFLSGEGNEMCPRWSPDGKQLAFIRQAGYGGQQSDLYLVAAEGGTPQLVSSWSDGFSQLAWAPDGSRITFISPDKDVLALKYDARKPAPRAHLWAVRLDRSRHIQTRFEGTWASGWGPPIRKVVTEEVSYWQPPEKISADDLDVHDYAWSHDSKQLAIFYSAGNMYRWPSQPTGYSYYEDDKFLDDWGHNHLGVMSSAGGSVRDVASPGVEARSLAWSHDSRSLAFLSVAWAPNGPANIFTVSEGDLTPKLIGDLTDRPSWCCWLPNGQLLCVSVKDHTHQISLVNVADGTSRVLEEDCVMLRDQPWLAITPDRRSFAAIHSTDQQPPDIWSGTLHFVDDQPVSIMWKPIGKVPQPPQNEPEGQPELNDAWAWREKGVALVNQGHWKEAWGAYERSLELEPTNAQVWRDQGWVLDNLNCWAEALAAYERSLELEPNDAWAWGRKGWVLEKLGNKYTAHKAYERSLELEPNNAQLWRHMGEFLERLGDRGEAGSAYQRAWDLTHGG